MDVANEQNVTVERVDSLARLYELGREWDSVQRRCVDKHVLMDHRWLCTWLEIFGRNKKPCVLVVREHGAVVGIVPLILSRGYELFPTRKYHVHMADEYRFMRVPRLVRLLPIRRLTFPLSGALTNRRSHLLFVSQEPRYYREVIRFVASISAEWDLLVLEGIPADSEQERCLLAALEASDLTTDNRTFTRETMYATLPASMKEYLVSKGSSFRKRMQECRQVEKRFPGLRIVEYRGAQIDIGMNKLLHLESRSWKAARDRKRTFYIGPERDLQTFHQQVARKFAATDGALVLMMEDEERPVAGVQCLEREGILAAIVTFLDTEYAAKLTATPMYRRLIEFAIERGYSEIDFSGKTANIAKWTNGTRHSNRYFVYNKRIYSTFLRALSTGASRAFRMVSVFRSHGDTPVN